MFSYNVNFFNGLMSAFQKYEDQVALHDGGSFRKFTYGQLNDYSGRVYRYLKERGIGREDIVMILLPRSLESFVAAVGVWRAGAAMILCESTMGQDRIDYIREDSGCKLVIDGETWIEITKEETLAGCENPDPHDLAYLVYTSGSTGKPKGVMHEFGDMDKSCRAKQLGGVSLYSAQDVVAINSTLSFVAVVDHSVNIFFNGACLLLIPVNIVKNPLTLVNVYEVAGVTATFMTPSLYRACGELNSQMQKITLGGEVCAHIYSGRIQLINGYNMSEAGRDMCLFPIDQAYDVTPVGKNRGGEEILILDEDGKPVKQGEVGEICFVNEYTRGYLHMPEKTEEAFRNGVFHTNDLGSQDENGNITIHGRNDDMIKINGNRIEPTEIEAVAKELLQVSWCAAKGFVDESRAFLCLYYVDDISIDEEWLRKELKKKLPYYMIPSYYIKIDKIPVLASGKMSRKDLPKPDVHAYEEEYVAPSNEVEEKLCKAFAFVLGLDRIGVNDDFYKLGGDSLSAIAAVTEAEIPGLSVMDIFSGHTIKKIAELCSEKDVEDISLEEMEEEARKKTYPLTPFQTNMLDYQLYTPNSTMWNLTFLFRMDREKVETERLLGAVNRVIEHFSMFATVFCFDEDCNMVQKYAPEKRRPVELERMTEEAFAKKKDALVEPFRMLNEPLYKIHVIETEEHLYLLNQVHHMIFDGSSLVIFEKSIVDAYFDRPLPADTYYACLSEMLKERTQKAFLDSKKYFQENFEGVKWCTSLPADHESRDNERGAFMIPMQVTVDQIEAAERKHGVSRNALSLAAILLALSKVTGEKDVLGNWIYSNRVDLLKQNTMGLLIKMIPVGLHMDQLSDLDAVLQEIRKQSDAGILHSAYEWSLENDNTFENDPFFMVYEMDMIGVGEMEKLGAVSVPVSSNYEAAIRSIAIVLMETEGQLVASLLYRKSVLEDAKVEKFVELIGEYAKTLFNE